MKKLILLLAFAACACGGTGKRAVTVRALPEANPEAAKRYLKASTLMQSESASSSARAEGLLKEALAIDGLLWEAHYNLGILYRRRGELHGAQRELEAAREIQPGAGEPLLALAEIYDVLDKPQQAAGALEDYLELDPKAQHVRVAWTALLRKQERFEDALAQARIVLLANPKDGGALLEVGRTYRQRGEYDAAELIFRRALLLDEKSPAPHNELGLTALMRGDTQLAFTHFAHAIEADKTFMAAHVNQAVVLLRAGDYEAAAREYRKVLEADGDHDDARVGLGVALRAQGKHADAEAEYERVLARTQNHAAALYDLALLRAEFLSQPQQARPLFERFVDVAGEGSARTTAQRYLDTLPKAPAPSKPAPATRSPEAAK